MDCEKFEAAMMDELYGELDQLTSAAAKRHLASCARCAGLLSGLRATRRLATLPLVKPPSDLEDRIVAAAQEAQPRVVSRRSFARAISLAGSWAMRPQTAMAAVFLVMIGTSVLLLRGRSSRAPASAAMTVTEEGTPAPATSVVSLAPPEPTAATSFASSPRVMESKPPPAPAVLAPTVAADLPSENSLPRATAKVATAEKVDEIAQSQSGAAGPMARPARAKPIAGAAGGAMQPAYGVLDGPSEQGTASPFNVALAAYQSGRFEDAARAFDSLAPSDLNADLWAARSVREWKGCVASVARFDKVAQRAAGTPAGWDALLEGGRCHRLVGDLGAARACYSALLNVDSHKDRARVELDNLDQLDKAAARSRAAATSTPPASAPSRGY
jgi:hypothetical protein